MSVPALLGLLGLLGLLACSPAAPKQHLSVPSTSTSTSVRAHAKTILSGPPSPLTGLPTASGPLNRPALSVKIDNVDQARPQSGVNDADIVFEELVEGGNSRLFAVYQSHDSPLVGPVRSARPVDADLLRALGGGIFAYSGAALGEIAPVKQHSNAVLVSDDKGSGGFHRDLHRQAPYNLYAATPALYTDVPNAKGSPAPLFVYGATPPAAAAPATEADVTVGPRATSVWRWNATTQLYERTQNGQPDLLSDGSLVTASNVVMMSVQIRGTGIIDQAHEEDPLVVVIGSGPCWVIRNGVLVAGQWQRPTLDSPTQLLTAGGTPIALQPGRTWVELVSVPYQPQFH